MRTIAVAPTKDAVISLSIDTLQLNKQALVFCSTKRGAESQAEKIATNIARQGVFETLQTKELTEKILNALATPTKQCKRLALCTKQGIAFHHAGLASKQRELIEDAFRDGIITIICSTPTLAAGLDLPAFRAIIRDTKRFGNRGMAPIPVLEYQQMAGRAGRPGKEEYGEALLLAGSQKEKEELFTQYVHGEVEDIYSKLAVEPVLRTYVLSLVATRFVKTKKELYSFFNKTFYAHQFSDNIRLQRTLDKMITQLCSWNFLETTTQQKKQAQEKKNDFFTSAASLLLKQEHTTTEENLQATVLGERVSQLYIDPLSAHTLLDGLDKLFTQQDKFSEEEQTTSLLHLLTCTLEMLPLLRAKVGDTNAIHHWRATQTTLLSEEEFYEQRVDEFDDTIQTTRCFTSWTNEETEDILLETYNIRPGELSVMLQKADWLLYACQELARINKKTTIIKTIKHTRTRLQHGVKAELLPLLAFKNIGRVRARKLYTHNIKTIADVEKASKELLAGIIGEKISQSVKEQVGQKTTSLALERQEYL